MVVTGFFVLSNDPVTCVLSDPFALIKGNIYYMFISCCDGILRNMHSHIVPVILCSLSRIYTTLINLFTLIKVRLYYVVLAVAGLLLFMQDHKQNFTPAILCFMTHIER